MPRNNHRPFLGLTWPQLRAVRKTAHGRGYTSDRRALWALSKKSVPLIELGTKVKLTEAGEDVWRNMQNWRPDLYRETNS